MIFVLCDGLGLRCWGGNCFIGLGFCWFGLLGVCCVWVWVVGVGGFGFLYITRLRYYSCLGLGFCVLWVWCFGFGGFGVFGLIAVLVVCLYLICYFALV